MSSVTMTIWATLALAVGGCGTSHPPQETELPGADAGPAALEGGDAPVDRAGPRIDGARVRVEGAWWRAPRELLVVASLRNGGATALPASPGAFLLRTEGGRGIPGRGEGPGACDRWTVAEPGAEARCLLRFELEGAPRRLEHAAGEAPIERCSEAQPFGLCPLGLACAGGGCEPRCSPTHQDGICANEDEVCQGGACVSPCSDLPGSGCEEGTCLDGRCEPFCHGLAIRDDGCWACLWDVIDAERCTVEERCRDCADCPGGRVPGEAARTTCDCLGMGACDGCEDPSLAYWGCLVEACPACRE